MVLTAASELASVTAGPSVYWYLTRSTGVVALLLLTAAVVLGVIDVGRWSTPRWPRFVVDSLHRSVSMLVLVFLGLHIITAALDSFAPISPVDAIIPFIGSYRPFWLGLGAVAFDLLLAIAITSVLRQRLGHRAWRITHWLAYACWPIALLHGLGTGSDVKSAWSLALTAMCVLAVVIAVCVRTLPGWPQYPRVRAGALALTAAVPIGLILWLPGGPLGHGWARRSGTPASLLASSVPSSSSRATTTASTAASNPSSSANTLNGPFTVSLAGSIKQDPGSAPGSIAVKITTSFAGPPSGQLHIEIDGQPVEGGGVSMRSSRVTLDGSSTPLIYRGRILALNGNRILASVRGGDGHSLSLQVALAVDSGAGTVSGTLTASPA
ncbi:MAG TPA: ferric reductase-like transmembrane domain-containing protein [Solirubrobacteraceae bacterium]|nr:ferric reductase-like transmembrane domain-containing protein [Solirubrobacteraceae bacterium]